MMFFPCIECDGESGAGDSALVALPSSCCVSFAVAVVEAPRTPEVNNDRMMIVKWRKRTGIHLPVTIVNESRFPVPGQCLSEEECNG